MPKKCKSCGEPCEPIEITVDDSFYYEYGAEARTHRQVGVETVSDCCEDEVEDDDDESTSGL